MSTLMIRFVGRFAFIPQSLEGSSLTRMHVIGLDMKFNQDLRADRHQLLLSVPHDNVSPHFPEPYAAIVSAEPSDEAVREYLMWDLSNTSLSINLSSRPPVTMTFDKTYNIGGPIDPKILSSTSPEVPVAFRFSAESGDFKEIFFEPETAPPATKEGQTRVPLRRASYELVPLDGVAVDTGNVSLPDGVVATFTIVGNPILKVRGFGGTLRTIHLKQSDKANGDRPIICSITNTCGEQEAVGVKDKEYAAFYDLLKTPPDILQRIVPRRVSLRADEDFGGGGGRCYKQAKASL